MKNLLGVIKSINRNTALYIVADGFYYAGYSVVDAFLSALITLKIAPGRVDLVGFVIGYYMFVRALTEIPISRFTRKLNGDAKRKIVSIGYITYGAFLIALGHASSLLPIFAIQTIIGLIDATVYPLKWPIFAKSVDKEEELSWALEDIAATLLPAGFTILAGVLSASFGIQAPFYLFGILLITSGGIFRFIKIGPQLISENQKRILKKLTKTLTANDIPFQITGGLAAIIYGAKNRPLFDIDIEVHRRDVPKITKLFSKYIIRPFGRYKDKQLDLKLLALNVDGVPVDVCQAEKLCLISPVGKRFCENVDLDDPIMVEFMGMRLPIESKADLIGYKRFLARETDLKDVAEIELDEA